MSRMAEAFQEQQELEEQAQQAEEELYHSLCTVIRKAGILGLTDDDLRLLCYGTGVKYEDLT